jgi:catechol 2,3-dioxygenase-like lactoylglutathione lyase family enzyme
MTTVRRLEHVGVVVEDLEAATQFFLDIGLEKEGATTVQGAWVDAIIGLTDVHADVVMLRTPDGTGKLELSRFHRPVDSQGPEAAASNRLGIRHVAFVVEGLDAILEKLSGRGVELVGAVQDYADLYRLCYLRGPAGTIVELIEESAEKSVR